MSKDPPNPQKSPPKIPNSKSESTSSTSAPTFQPKSTVSSSKSRIKPTGSVGNGNRFNPTVVIKSGKPTTKQPYYGK